MKFSHTTLVNILIFIVIIIIIYFLCNQTESFSGAITYQSNEAIQQLASIFNNKKMVVDTIQATNQFMGNVTGNVTGDITSINGEYKLSITNNGILQISDVSGNIKWTNATLQSPSKTYTLSLSDNGKIKLVDGSGNRQNIFGDYTGRFWSPQGDYFVSTQNNSGSGVLIGYTYNSSTNNASVEANVANSEQNINNIIMEPIFFEDINYPGVKSETLSEYTSYVKSL